MTLINNDSPLALVQQRNADGVSVATFAQQQSWRRIWENAWCENEASKPSLSQTTSDRNDPDQLTTRVVPTVAQEITPDDSQNGNSMRLPSHGVDSGRHTMTLPVIPTLGQAVAELSPNVIRAILTLPAKLPESVMPSLPVASTSHVPPNRAIEMVIQAATDIARKNVNVFFEGGALHVAIRDKGMTPAAITRLLPQLKRVAIESQLSLAVVIVNGERVWDGQIESTSRR